MVSSKSKIAVLKRHLESAAFFVSKGKLEREAHSEIVQSLIIVSELDLLMGNQDGEVTNDEVADMKEVRKVNRRLKLWAKRPNQINSKILNAFLRLKRSGLAKITEVDLKGELKGEKSFDSNFSQMKIVAEKNHGKVFEQYGENISLWSPIIQGVGEYEAVVFGDR